MQKRKPGQPRKGMSGSSYQDHCNTNYAPSDNPQLDYEICSSCNGCGYSIPQVGRVCDACEGYGEVPRPLLPVDGATRGTE